MATNLENKINRVQTNVTAALAALVEKGVTVPTGANSDDLETLIKAIASGSDVDFKIGMFNPSETLTHYDIQHELGKIPSFGLLVAGGISKGTYMSLYNDGKHRVYIYCSDSWSTSGNAETPVTGGPLTGNVTDQKISSSSFYQATERTIRVGNHNMSTGWFKAGITFIWVVGVVE